VRREPPSGRSARVRLAIAVFPPLTPRAKLDKLDRGQTRKAMLEDDVPFRPLPAQPPINPRADVYVETALRLSRLAAMTTRHVLDIPYGPDPVQRLAIYLPDRDALN